MLASTLFIALIASGLACNDVEDPIRNFGSEGPKNASRVERVGRKGTVNAVTTTNHPGLNTFYEGDSYVIQYSKSANTKPDIIYFWQGTRSSVFEKGLSAAQASLLDRLNGDTAKQVRVEQGHEPAHFLNMFNGAFVTLIGGKDRGKEVKDTDGVHLFKVESECNSVGDKKPLTRTSQVEETKGNILSDDVFILKTKNKLFVYQSPGSSPEEKATANKVVASLYPGITPVQITSSSNAEFQKNLI